MVTSRLFSRATSLGLFGTAAFVAMLSTTRVLACSSKEGNFQSANSVYDFTANDLNGNPVKLEKYRGHVLIIVNVASQCGYTAKHYKEFNQLHDELAESKGLRILAFPSNQFANQEPGSSNDILRFLEEREVKFDVFQKIDVNGDSAHPLYKYLKEKQGGTLFDAIKWNFTKFIVDKNGIPVERIGPNTSPMEMKEDLMKYF